MREGRNATKSCWSTRETGKARKRRVVNPRYEKNETAAYNSNNKADVQLYLRWRGCIMRTGKCTLSYPHDRLIRALTSEENVLSRLV